jgi:DNA-binding NarL/FixJ family response regulator
MNHPPSIVKVMLAGEQALLRDAVRAFLEGEEGLEVVAEADEGFEAVSAAERERPDVAVVLADLRNCDGIRATALIRERVPGCRVLYMTDRADGDALLEAVLAGASGYLTKESPLEDLTPAARAIHQGHVAIPTSMLRGLLEALVERRRQQGEAQRLIARLTAREKQVLALLAEGGGNDTIAEALVISRQTVRTHIQNVLGKLEVHSRLEAAAFVALNGVRDELAQAGV